MSLSTEKENNFDAIVVAELQILRTGERRLERLYSDLRTKPQLRTHFMRELAELKLRAGRLEAVLSPVGTLDLAGGSVVVVQ